ncbi:hypothetical protein QDR34_08805 [Acinetobacter baumannii]|uniref:hypothetical protein n=1 Tax=Acinetobacter baumannii TaxID=470 RepID=UPI00244D4DEC|nr:hypothetical protein [Acinetobacter baumannii]MDH2468179.1 hypothetical protein [Acinetobacter baumannii]MDO7517838.1 hypothetical protein [Acinetobacter baumannii]HCH7476744.1 hypothetical protein [Acinetobacter baumannii]
MTREELINLTEYFYNRWYSGNISIPLHLIMWLYIYTCRREDESTRLKLENLDQVHQEWLLEDVKHPTDQEGNDKYFRIDQLANGVIEQFEKDIQANNLEEYMPMLSLLPMIIDSKEEEGYIHILEDYLDKYYI